MHKINILYAPALCSSKRVSTIKGRKCKSTESRIIIKLKKTNCFDSYVKTNLVKVV